jgi:3-oxoacyl-[acyl-carrier protein] reductase
MKYTEIKIGTSAEVTHKITESDIDKFVELTGDDNKLHINKEFASRTEFKKPVVHGMLGASFISTLIGTKLPGDGALWFSQTLDFLRPVRVGDTITVSAVVINKNDKSNSIELKINIYNQNKQIVTTGISKIKIVEIESQEIKNNENIIRKKIALVIGASGGVGSAAAIRLANDGFDLILHYNSNIDIVTNLANKIIELGRNVTIIKANLLIDSEIDYLVSKINREFENLSAFVNCSTVKIPIIKFENLGWEEVQNHIDINIKSNFLILKSVLKIFEKNNYGKVVFLSTLFTDSPTPQWLHYMIGKSALNGFAKALAIEFANKKININLISPGLIDTDLVADISSKTKMLIEARTPLQRLCTKEDVASAISFLLSSDSDFITGETIRINGGLVMI